jgi:hypothetical protein
MALLCQAMPAEIPVSLTNEQQFMRLASEAARDAADSARITAQGLQRIVLHSGSQTQFFRLALVGAVATPGQKISEETGRAELTLQVNGLSVEYGERFNNGIFEKALTTRSLGFHLGAMASDSAGTIRWVGVIEKKFVDTVAVDDIGRLEQTTGHFAKGVVPERFLWERLLEPAIMIGASGIAIYLFFTIRS